MKEFQDAEGRHWRASARQEPSVDYKGRYFLVLEPLDGGPEILELPEVRWNSQRTAARTIGTMSQFELRRRLRSALGRSQELRAS
jgi:hypothetical protein